MQIAWCGLLCARSSRPAHMVLATGRTSHSGASHGFGNLPLEIVGSNGAIIRDAHGTVLKSFVIDQVLVEDLLRTFR